MKYSFIALLTTLLFISCKKEATGNLHITGNIKGLKKGTLYIQKLTDSTLTVIDTIEFNGDSKFTSDLYIKSPEMLYLFLDRGVSNSLDNNLIFFAEPGNINIETSLDYFLSDAKITGSKNQEKYDEFKKVVARFNNESLDLVEKKFKAYQNKNFKAVDSLTESENQNLKRRYLYITNFALNNKDLEVSPYLALTEIPDINLKYLDTIQKSMTPKVAESTYGKRLKEFYKERKKLGQ